MAGTVHLVSGSNPTAPPPSRFAAVLDTAIFVCLIAIALCAPLSIKGAVNAFRAATVFWIILLCTRQRRLLPQPLAVPLLCFLVLTAISSALSTDPSLSWGRMRTVVILLLAIVVGQTVRSLRQIKILVSALVFATLLTVLYTGWQYSYGIGVQAVGDSAVVASLRHFGFAPGDIIRTVNGKPARNSTDLLTQLGTRQASTTIVLWRETPNALQSFPKLINSKALLEALQQPGIKLIRAHPPRAQGFYKHYFPFSAVLVLVGLLVFGVAMDSKPIPRLALIAAFLAITITIELTLTRSALAALFIGVLAILLARSPRRPGWLIAALILIASISGIYWMQRHRTPFSPDSGDPGTEYRLLMWRDSLTFIKAHPFFGVGLDSVAGDWQKWDLEAYRRFGLHSHFHSTPIQIAVECGLPALAAWIWIVATYAVFLFRLQRNLIDHEPPSRGLGLGIFAGLIAFVLNGFLQYNLGDAEVVVLFWFSMGLAFALYNVRVSLPTSPADSRV